jgi:hypothetical protein
VEIVPKSLVTCFDCSVFPSAARTLHSASVQQLKSKQTGKNFRIFEFYKMANYKDISSTRKSEVWKHFLYSQDLSSGLCRLCDKVIKAESTTTGLSSHLKSIHNIEVLKCVVKSANEGPTKAKHRRIDQYFQNGGPKSLGEVLSLLAAEDGISFNRIAQSKNLRPAFRDHGYNLPLSANTVRIHVLKFALEIKTMVKEDLIAKKEADVRFSITFDEWTSIGNTRFMNLNVHYGDGNFYSLGMIHVKGSMPATRAIQMVKERLESFGLNLDHDIVSESTDGASIMKKFGHDTKPLHTMCYAHAIHLAVSDILLVKKRRKKQQTPEVPEQQESDSESDSDENDIISEDEFGEGFDIETGVNNDVEVDFCDKFQGTIGKVRKIVKIFKRSPVSNDDELQPEILAKHGKEMRLLLDSKTRWSSTVTMLKRFHEVKTEVQMALILMNKPFDLNEDEIKMIENLVSALEPLQVATEALCSANADLVFAEGVIKFTKDTLSDANTEISSRIKEQFELRIEERRICELVHLMEYLSDPDYLMSKKDQFDHKIQRSKIEQLATRLLQRLFPSGDEEDMQEEINDEIEMELCANPGPTDKNLSLKEKLYQFTNKSRSGPQLKYDIGSQLVKKEMNLFEATKNRPSNLEKLYNALMTIPPTSVEPERAFSSASLFVTKIRNRLKPETIDVLSFLRQFFRK